MITKKLIHDISTFHNTFIDVEGIIIKVDIYNATTSFIMVSIKLWSFNDGGLIDVIEGVTDNIHNYKEFERYKENVRNKIVPLLNK